MNLELSLPQSNIVNNFTVWNNNNSICSIGIQKWSENKDILEKALFSLHVTWVLHTITALNATTFCQSKFTHGNLNLFLKPLIANCGILLPK